MMRACVASSARPVDPVEATRRSLAVAIPDRGIGLVAPRLGETRAACASDTSQLGFSDRPQRTPPSPRPPQHSARVIVADAPLGAGRANGRNHRRNRFPQPGGNDDERRSDRGGRKTIDVCVQAGTLSTGLTLW